MDVPIYITLTSVGGKPIEVRADSIEVIFVRPKEKGAIIVTASGREITVQEAPERVKLLTRESIINRIY